MRIDLDSYVPVGVDGKREAGWLLGGLAAAALIGAAGFLNRYLDARQALYYSRALKNQLIHGAVITGFPELIGGSSTGFSLICLVMPFLAAYHYLYHYRGSRSIYLMRRLPDRWELHRRCLAIPTVGLVAAMAVLGLLGIVFYAIYILCTPAQCLPV